MIKFLHLLKRIVFWVFFISLFVITSITILLRIYEDDIEQFAVAEINKFLNTEVEVQDIELSMLSNFPYASLDFQKVLIKDAYENIESDDTLFYSKNLYLNFNVWDIWNEDYTVKNVLAQDGVIKLKTTKNGDVNYLITKPSKDSAETNFNFQLNELNIIDIKFEFSNIATQQFYKITLEDTKFEGDFSEKEYNLKAKSKLFINKLKSNSFALINHKNAFLDLNLHINNLQNEYTFKQSDLTIEKMPFQITGIINSSEINLTLKGKGIQLDELTKSLLNNSISQLKNYESKGSVTFNASIKGPILKTEMPSIIANFSIKNGSVLEKTNNLSLDKINLVGRYHNKIKGRKELLEIADLSVQLLSSKIQGSTKIIDFKIPTFIGHLKGNIDLASFQQFFKFKGVEKLTGQVDFNSNYSIQFTDIEYNPQLFTLDKTHGELKINNVAYKGIDNPLVLKNISGDILIKGNDAATKNLSVKTSKSDFILNGAIKNLIPFIEGKGNLGLIASIESNTLDINEFMVETTPNNIPNNRKPKPFEIPNTLNLNIDLDVKNLFWKNHQFNDIKGELILANHKASVKHFTLKTIGGTIAGNIKLDNLIEKGNIIDGQLKLTNLNITKLFSDWNNFDQKTITDKNLSGTLNGKIDLLLFFDSYFTIIEDKMLIKTDMNINNGELNNMSTMKDITEYMRTNKALKLALNKHIDKFESKITQLKFDNLTNSIRIENRKITIPKMLIKTNALDVQFSGWHDFDNNIEYHFSFRFRELKSGLNESEFGIIEDDGSGWRIYLTMSGNIDNPKYSLDKGERNATFKANIEEEKTTMKSILKSEFGLFKKDSTVKNMESISKSEAFEFIVFEEDSVYTINDSLPKKSKQKKRSNKFFEKLKEKSLEEKEFENLELDND